jgi:hypothetical protein
LSARRLLARLAGRNGASQEEHMTDFIYLYRGGQMSQVPSEMQARMQKWTAWMGELQKKGHLKDRGHPLERTGKTVSGKDKNVTDGPYPEKDIIGGFSLIQAENIEQAVALSQGCPMFLYGGLVEVRALMKMEG